MELNWRSHRPYTPIFLFIFLLTHSSYLLLYAAFNIFYHQEYTTTKKTLEKITPSPDLNHPIIQKQNHRCHGCSVGAILKTKNNFYSLHPQNIMNSLTRHMNLWVVKFFRILGIKNIVLVTVVWCVCKHTYFIYVKPIVLSYLSSLLHVFSFVYVFGHWYHYLCVFIIDLIEKSNFWQLMNWMEKVRDDCDVMWWFDELTCIGWWC